MAARDVMISVVTEWNGWNTAEVPLASLTDVHWHQPRHAPRALIHGHVLCTDIVRGQVPHACQAGESHQLTVCVLKRHNAPSVFAELSDRAAERASTPNANGRTPAAIGVPGAAVSSL